MLSNVKRKQIRAMKQQTEKRVNQWVQKMILTQKESRKEETWYKNVGKGDFSDTISFLTTTYPKWLYDP